MPVKITRVPSVQRSAKAERTPRAPYKDLTSELGPERMALMDSMFLNGDTCEAIAKTIKLEWKLLAGTKLGALSKMLGRYKQDRIVGKLAYLADPNEPTLSEFGTSVNVLENLISTVSIQQKRITKALSAERRFVNAKSPLDNSLRKEIQTLALLYRQLSDLQMDLGLLRKVPAKLQVEGVSARTQQMLENAMKRGDRVDEALAKAFRVIEGAVIGKDDGQQVKH